MQIEPLQISPYSYLILLSVFIGSILVTYLIIPNILIIIKREHLLDSPNERSSHTSPTATLGGIAFFICIVLSTYLLKELDFKKVGVDVLFCVSIMLLIGVKDDLVGVSPKIKLFAQILVGIILSLNFNFNILSFHGTFNVFDIPLNLSPIINILFFVVIINAVNLVDGIDGLAAGLCVFMFISFAVIYLFVDNVFMSGLSLAGVGTCIGFLRYNLSRNKKYKIFMGDTGSLILGTLIGILSVQLFSTNDVYLKGLPFKSENLFFVIAAIIFVPVFDLSRVFFMRIIRGKSPFHADRTHIHHVVVDSFQLTHKKASLFIVLAAALFASIVIIASSYMDWIGMTILFSSLTMIVSFVFRVLCKKMAKKNKIRTSSIIVNENKVVNY